MGILHENTIYVSFMFIPKKTPVASLLSLTGLKQYSYMYAQQS